MLLLLMSSIRSAPPAVFSTRLSRLSRLAFTRRFVRCINGEFGKLFKNVDFCVSFCALR